VALGHDLARVSEDVGHSDMAVTYRMYTHVMRLEDEEGESNCVGTRAAGFEPATSGSGGMQAKHHETPSGRTPSGVSAFRVWNG
jgi:hypothetical protein